MLTPKESWDMMCPTGLTMEGSLSALEMALANKCYGNQPLIHHSDRGLPYCSNDYQALLDENNIKASMTEK
jgi:transposase InsO family protein